MAGNAANITGPVLVIAGAGSGKTSTLAQRVAHLIVNGADPGRILLLTFSRIELADDAAESDWLSMTGQPAAQGSPDRSEVRAADGCREMH